MSAPLRLRTITRASDKSGVQACHPPPVSLPVTLALVDAAAGLYFLWYSLRRERRDRDAVMVVGATHRSLAARGGAGRARDLAAAPGQLV